MTAESCTVVEHPFFYYHSTTIHCRDLPRFAGLARISGRNVRFSQCANRGKTSPCEALEAYDEDFIYLPRQQSVTERISRHWRAKRGKSGQLDEKPTTVLLPMRKDRSRNVRNALQALWYNDSEGIMELLSYDR